MVDAIVLLSRPEIAHLALVVRRVPTCSSSSPPTSIDAGCNVAASASASECQKTVIPGGREAPSARQGTNRTRNASASPELVCPRNAPSVYPATYTLPRTSTPTEDVKSFPLVPNRARCSWGEIDLVAGTSRTLAEFANVMAANSTDRFFAPQSSPYRLRQAAHGADTSRETAIQVSELTAPAAATSTHLYAFSGV